jgi:hypothetical protein
MYKRTQILPILIQNKSALDIPILFFGSTFFNFEPRSKIFKRNDSETVEVMFSPPADISENTTIYGFGLAASDIDHKLHAIQLLGKPNSEFHIYPIIGKDGISVIDFGKIELSTNSFDNNVKHVTMCNNFPSAYSWSMKFLSSKSKYHAFDAPLMSGELLPYETFALPFRFKCDSSGVFESIMEISIKESLDRLAKPIKIVNVILRAHAVNSNLTGFPDRIDFGSTLINHRKQIKFTISNSGTSDAKVLFLCKSPYHIEPESFEISPKEIQDVVITFNPTESRTSSFKLQVFFNQRLIIVPVTGTGGNAELLCEKYENKPIEFGSQKELSIAWTSIYLTNKGTLPLTLELITADQPDLVRLQFIDTTAIVPLDNGNNDKSSIKVYRDLWGILRRKIKTLAILNGLDTKSITHKKSDPFKRKTAVRNSSGHSLTILKSGSLPDERMSTLGVPELRPFHSYHFRIGYLHKYQSFKNTNVHFHYLPVTSEYGDETTRKFFKCMTLRILGKVYRPLELVPTSHDFGLAPAEIFSKLESWKIQKNQSSTFNVHYGVYREGQTDEKGIFYLEVLNMSFEPDNLTLKQITNEFTVNGRGWYVGPGDRVIIPIEFHPTKEQIQYRGEAVFSHNYGTQVINLFGTGASADLYADDLIDFGSIKYGSVGNRSFRICNRGLLECRYLIEISQQGTDYRLANGEPFEYEGSIGSGVALMVEMNCCCQSVKQQDAFVLIKWERIPGGLWEDIVIPITVKIGLPIFKPKLLELDFQTTYINVNKTLEFDVVNDGTAACAWSSQCDSEFLLIDPEDGVLNPGETVKIQVTYTPDTYDSLTSQILFNTDAGQKIMMCYGIVGIPYLAIPEDDLDIEFGIAVIQKTHTRQISLRNSGSRLIEFEIILLEMMRDGIIAPKDDYEVFFTDPTNGIIPPGQTTKINIQCIPRIYGSTITSRFNIRTKDGEQYSGRLSVTGGRAIIKIAPPDIKQNIAGEKPQTAEIKMKGSSQSKLESSPIEAARLAFQSHIENLQDIVAGLRTAEIDFVEKKQKEDRAGEVQPIKEQYKPDGRPVSSQKAFDGTPAERKQREIETLELSSALLADKADMEKKKRQLSAGKVFDGSDLRSRVQQAVESITKNSPRRSRVSMEDSEEFTMQGTSSGRVRITSRQGIDNVFDRDGPRNSASARRRKSAVEDNHSQIENSTVIKYMDDLSILENQLEDITAAIRGIGSLSGTPNSSRSGLGRYNAGSSRKHIRSASPLIPSRPSTRDSVPVKEPAKEEKENSASGDQSKAENQNIDAENNLLIDVKQSTDRNPEEQRRTVEGLSKKILESTKGVIKAVKDQLSNKWIDNREFLASSLRKVQKTTMVIEALNLSKVFSEKLENEFSLGLLKAGDRMSNILLFDLPNTGNIAFEFDIIPNDGSLIRPTDFDSNRESELLSVDPMSGYVKPGEKIKFSANFYSNTPGLYQQGFDLFSGGEKVIGFTITAKVGTPILIIEPNLLDFGLVTKNRTGVRTLIISNVGSYRDSWKFEQLVASQGMDEEFLTSLENPDKPPYIFSSNRGELQPGEVTPLQVTFAPKKEGPFNYRYRLTWSGETRLVDLKGIGGGAKIKSIMDSPGDVKYGGLDWGICIVGCSYTKTFQVTNLGNVTGYLKIKLISDLPPFINIIALGMRNSLTQNRSSSLKLTSMRTGMCAYLQENIDQSQLNISHKFLKLPKNLFKLLFWKALILKY